MDVLKINIESNILTFDHTSKFREVFYHNLKIKLVFRLKYK